MHTIKIPRNKYFFVCFAGESSSKAMWSWYYDYVAPEYKHKSGVILSSFLSVDF